MHTEFDIKISDRDLFLFQMYNAYHGTQGWAALILAGVAVAMYCTKFGQVPIGYSILYLVFAVVFALYIPVSLFLQAKAQFKRTKAFQDAMHYALTDEGIDITAGDEKGQLPWNMVYKVVCTKDYLYIFGSRVNAYIIPLEQITNQRSEIKAVLTDKIESFRLKIKKL